MPPRPRKTRTLRLEGSGRRPDPMFLNVGNRLEHVWSTKWKGLATLLSSLQKATDKCRHA